MDTSVKEKSLSVTFLFVVVLIFTVLNGVRLFSAIQSWAMLENYSARPGAGYFVSTGAFWLVSGSLLLFGLYKRLSWTPLTLANTVGLYALYFWVDRLFIQESILQNNSSFMLGLTAVLFSLSITAVFISKNLFNKEAL